MVDISSLGEMAGLLQNLPEIMFWAQAVIYIFLILFFGSIAMKGYKGYLRGKLHLLLRIGSGFVCLVAGIGLSSFLPLVSENMILKIAQIDLIIGGIISSLVLLVSLYIITLRFPRSAVINKKIEALRQKLAKTKDRPPSPRKLDPYMIIGAVIITAFLIISLMNFRGFPDMTEDMLSQLGITPEELSQLGSVLGGTGGSGGGPEGLLPEGVVIEGGKPLTEQSAECQSAMLAMASIKSQLQDPEFLMSHIYSDKGIKSMIEESGKNVMQMYRVTEGGSDIIIAVTEDAVTGDIFSCFATPSELCLCAGAGS